MKTLVIEDKNRVEEIIRSCDVCYVGVMDAENLPYVVPMNFGYKDNYIYLHGADFGKLIESLRLNPQVCITICTKMDLTWQDAHVACSYRVKGSSIIARGKVEFVTDFDEKVQALDIIMENYSDRKFKYGAPAVRNVEVYKVCADELSARDFGVPHDKKFPWEQKG